MGFLANRLEYLDCGLPAEAFFVRACGSALIVQQIVDRCQEVLSTKQNHAKTATFCAAWKFEVRRLHACHHPLPPLYTPGEV
jgi:hypothetical protein